VRSTKQLISEFNAEKNEIQIASEIFDQGGDGLISNYAALATKAAVDQHYTKDSQRRLNTFDVICAINITNRHHWYLFFFAIYISFPWAQIRNLHCFSTFLAGTRIMISPLQDIWFRTIDGTVTIQPLDKKSLLNYCDNNTFGRNNS
jgi:hypothetical protein